LYVTQVFDEDRSGKLDFVEYMMAVQSTKLRTPEDKLNWIFKIYDKVRDKFQVGKFG
jgi:Ca2+-binding EF-hand superfamily protein